MKSPERITIALDEETAGLFKKMKEDLRHVPERADARVSEVLWQTQDAL